MSLLRSSICVIQTAALLGASAVLAGSPAATTVSNAAYFEFETQQLSDALVESSLSNSSGVAATLFQSTESYDSPVSTADCKVFPGDADWPSNATWDAFNSLLGGSLIPTIPSASSCWPGWGDYSEAECDYVNDEWTISWFHDDDPTSVMWPLYQGRTCLPTDYAVYDNCTLGGYPSYAVNVSTVAEIQLAVNFARNANLRLVVKNTGHDFNGKSAGAGGLSVWTHWLKNIELIDYSSTSYTGQALKVGSGIQAQEIYAAAKEYGVTAVGGEGRSVGVAGGYVAGGGHSPLSSLRGMAADQVVEMEVVKPDGTFVTASPESETDLFYALRGGGGGTYGVVTSMTVKTYPITPVTVSTFSYLTGGNVTADVFWDSITAWMSHFIEFTDAGLYAYFWIIPLGSDSFIFEMQPFFAPNMTVAEFNALVQPYYDELSALGISVTPNTTYYDNFYDAWYNAFPLESVGTVSLKTASRLFPTANLTPNTTLFDTTMATFRNTTTAGAAMLSFMIKGEDTESVTTNAVNPAWRATRLHAITSTSWDANATVAEIEAASDALTYGIMDQWRAISPGAGAYMSEADIDEPDFEQAFYGTENYATLSAIKSDLDPWELFYVPTGVGSEDWVVESADGLPTQNGRLCKA